MKRISLFFKCGLSLLLGASIILSCKKSSETAEPTASQANISYYAKAYTALSAKAVAKAGTVSTPVDSASMDVSVNWVSATVWVEKISLTAKGKSTLDTTILIGKKLNIFSANALAGVFKLPAYSYKDVQMKMFCRKSPASDFAFHFKGTFKNSSGGIDSLQLGSSYPFEANLSVSEMTVDAAGQYNATFSFALNKTLTGISARALQSQGRFYTGNDGKKLYTIWKGGSADEPFYDQIIQNWQSVASVEIVKGG